MLINLFGRWVNPQNILAVVSVNTNSDEKVSKIIFNNSSEAGFGLEFKDKTPTDIATEINNAISASKKSAFADRGEKRGGDRGGYRGGGYKGGDRGGRDDGFKKKFDRDDRGGDRGGYKGRREERPARGSDEYKEGVREDFKKKKFEGERKFESKSRGDFKPKKRRDW